MHNVRVSDVRKGIHVETPVFLDLILKRVLANKEKYRAVVLAKTFKAKKLLLCFTDDLQVDFPSGLRLLLAV